MRIAELPKTTLPRIFVALAGRTLSAREAQAARVSSGGVGYELRLDYLVESNNLESRLHQMLLRLHSPPTIATCRRAEAGGLFHGTVEEQVAVLSAAVRAGCYWVDVETESVARAGSSLLRRFRP